MSEKSPMVPRADSATLNWTGRVLVFITAVIAFAFGIWFTPWLAGKLGWIFYPKVIFVVPIVLAGLAFWIPSYFLCEKLGIPLTKQPGTSPARPADWDRDAGGQ